MSQFLRPNGNGLFSISTVVIPSGTRYSVVDEVIPDDSDFVEFVDQDSFVEWLLTDPTDPNSHIGHIVRIRRKAAGSSTDAKHELIEYVGASSITHIAVSEGGILPVNFGTVSFSLSEAIAANIIDYSKLGIRVTNTGTGNLQVSWMEMEVPDEVVNPIGSASITLFVIDASSGATFAGPPRSGTGSNTMLELLASGTTIYDASPRTGPISITNPELAASGTGLFAATVGLAAPSMPEPEAAGVGTTLNPVLGNATMQLELISLLTDSTQIQDGTQVGDWQEDSKEVDTWVPDSKEQDVWTEDSKEQDVWS